jgi:hypothetical protein
MGRLTAAAPSWRQLTPQTSLLLVAAAGAWVGVVALARGMGSMPGTMGLGVGSFIAVWALMMSAMMLPSVHRRADALTAQRGLERGEIVGDNGLDIGGENGGAGPFVFAPLSADLM